MLYAIAAASLVFVGYLAHEFYCEQLRSRFVPVRVRRNRAAQRARCDGAGQ